MSDESSKTRKVRGPEFVRRYFEGRSVIDIGCGRDLVVPWAQPFDLEHGDANRICDYLAAESFDTVHSSHCLEHMLDPRAALAQWWRLLKPGGFLITVVPDEELYEQGFWPSLFNADHKWAFTLDEERDPWPPHLVRLSDVHLALPGAELVDVQKHDHGYRRALLYDLRRNLSSRNFGRYRICMRWIQTRKLDRLALRLGVDLSKLGWGWLARRGIPVDQTHDAALAQLQIIVRKRG